MPTSTVKRVSGPLKPQNIDKIWRGLFDPHSRFFRTKDSQTASRLLTLVACFLVGLASLVEVNAEALRVRISITSAAPAKIRIDAEQPVATNVLSFRNAYGGVLGLGERIDNVRAGSASGENIQVQKLAPGEFQAAEKFTRFNYEVILNQPLLPAEMSHVSWLNRDQGLLMLADLLPVSKDSANPAALIHLEVPNGWAIAANVKSEGDQRYSADDPDKAVFMIGSSLRLRNQRSGVAEFSIITSGKWPFSDGDITKIVGRILEEYAKVTGFELKRNAILMLIPYPGEVGPQNWTAETRDNDVVLLLGRHASGKKVLEKLGIVLSHEFFHLWVPNSLKLEGDYDWFFEGFTLYQALRLDLRLGLISFQDYLNTVARVYDSYLSSADHDRWSLVEASERRWTASSSLVYDKGMLVAFIYDLLLRNHTGCNAAIDDVYRQLFRLHSTGHASANETIISLLNEPEGLKYFGRDYVQSVGRINLDAVLTPYGIQVRRGTGGTQLVVGRDLGRPQQEMLRCIRYRR